MLIYLRHLQFWFVFVLGYGLLPTGAWAQEMEYAETIPEPVQQLADRLSEKSACSELALMYAEAQKLYVLLCENNEFEPSYFMTAAGALKKTRYTVFSALETNLSVAPEVQAATAKIKSAAEQKIGPDNEVQWIYRDAEPGKADVYIVVCYMAQPGDFIYLTYSDKAMFLTDKGGL
jgi:hypothetical protein